MAVAALWSVAPARAQTSATLDDESPSLAQALRDGDLDVALRYRFEGVDDDAFDARAEASTLRASVGYRTLPWSGLSAHVEFSAVTTLGAADGYADAGAGGNGNGVTGRPVVADPELTRVNQVSAAFERGPVKLSAGRLEIALDDQRFVGPVKWRQNYQTFASARIEGRVSERLRLRYAFVDRAYTVTGGERPMASHLANAALDAPGGLLVAYAYLLDFENEAEAGQSTRTFGLRYSGQRDAGALTLGYEAAWAHQRDHATNPARVRADYSRLGASAGVPKLTLEAGWEVLGGSAEEGRFTTPLATLHAFNGWADRFLATPALGLEDLWVGLRGTAGPASWRAVFHDFGAAEGGGHYGRELDLLATYRTPWKQTLGVKAAFYDADAHATDVTKLWVFTAYAF